MGYGEGKTFPFISFAQAIEIALRFHYAMHPENISSRPRILPLLLLFLISVIGVVAFKRIEVRTYVRVETAWAYNAPLWLIAGNADWQYGEYGSILNLPSPGWSFWNPGS